MVSDPMESPWFLGQMADYWTFGICYTFATSHLSITASEVCAAANQTKIKKYSYLISHSYHFFTPVAFETSGVCGPRSMSFLTDLGRRIANTTGDKSSLAYLRQRCPSFLVICLVPSCTDVEMSTHVRCFHKINICNDVKMRLQTSGPPFKGLVVQSRRSTAVFDGSSSFVGSFASGGADWKQWNCESPSATHSGSSLKTSVNLIWKAPDAGNGKNVTFWYSIVADYATYHAQLKGPELVPDPQSCASGPLNYLVCSSSVQGQTLTAACNASVSLTNVTCAIDGELPKPCKLPHSMDIASLSNGKHSMRILLNDQSAETMSFTLNDAIANTLVCQSDVRNNVLNICSHSTNANCHSQGSLNGLPSGAHKLTVLATDTGGANISATTKFNTTGPRFSCIALTMATLLNVNCVSDTPFITAKCSLNQDTPKPCTIPYTRDISVLSVGSHQVTVSVNTTTGTMLTTTESFVAKAVLRLSCVADVRDSILSMNCNSSSPVNNAMCLIDGKAAHACTLPYTRSVSALSTGIHTISISASGANGVNGSFAANFSVQAHLGLSCKSAANSSVLVLTCTSNNPLSLLTCAIDGKNRTPCTIPYARDITDLAIGAHTIAVTATGVNGATAAVTEYFTRPEFLRCTGILNSSVLAIQCNSSKALKDVWCTLDNKETHACVLPYVRSVSSLSTGLHTMNISATAVTGVVVSDTVPFNLQARLTLNCSRTFQNSMLVVRCSPSSPLDDVSCSFDAGVQRTCHLPLAFNASSLTPGEHTVHITAKGSNGATATSSLTFQIDAVDWVKCHSDVTDSVLTVTCNASMPTNRIVCTIDGKGSHQCMLPYVRRVTSLSLGRHALSLYFIGENGRNTTVEMDFFIQARLNLQCSYIIAEGAKLMVSCTPSDLLARATCAVNNETLQSCNLPYTRDVSVLPRGVHTVTVSATGTNGVSSISVLSFDNTATISLNCIAAGSAPIDRVLVVNCTSSAPLSYATCAVDGEIPLPCVFPHVKNVLSLPSGVHVVAVSAIGTNRASSVAMVKFNVADLVANCSGAVHGRNLYITCDANYPIQFTTCSVGQRQPQQCDMPITLPVDNFSEGIHSLDITVNATNKAATVSVRFMVNTDGSAVLLKP
ncbi:hypothetical protein EMCRGX_G012001 [Ephydatia muelleri]